MKTLILASTSPRRKELLAEAGVVFDVVASSYEEDMTLDMSPSELAKFLSQGKAQTVADEYPDAVVIGADTFIAFEGKVLGKPHTKEKTKAMLSILNGKQHSVITGFTIINKSADKIISQSVETKVYFKHLSEQEIDDYVALGESLDKAGAYAFQDNGHKLVDKIEGSRSNIVGLPMDEVLVALKSFT